MIVGLDPGTTVGLAVLDLRGNLLHLSSKKGADDFWIFQTMRPYGVPVVLATDKASVPARVKKIAAQLGAKLWAPREDVPVSTKEEIARRFSYHRSGPEDDHQRDALAAAFLAFQSYAPKFRQVEKKVGDNREKEEFVKKAVVFGQSMDRAIREYDSVSEERPSLPQQSSPKREDVSPLLKRIAELREEIRRKDELINSLKDRIAELERENESLRKSARRLPVHEELEKLRMQRDEARRRANRFARQIRRLERILEAVAKGKYVIVDRRSAGKRVVLETEKVAVVEPEEGESEEELAERIARLIEEYRAGKK